MNCVTGRRSKCCSGFCETAAEFATCGAFRPNPIVYIVRNMGEPVTSAIRLLLLLALAPLAAAAQAATPVSAPAAAPPPVATNRVGADYVIGPGDTLQVFVWRNPELTATVPVRPDGRVSTPLVEDMVAVGKTPTALARDIEKVLSEYVKQPQVNVIVTQPMSSFSQVKIVGQVVRQQSLAYREGMTVLDAVLACGGLGTFAAGNRAKIVRTENGKQLEVPVRLSALINQGDLKQNLLLKPGDVLMVPESRF